MAAQDQLVQMDLPDPQDQRDPLDPPGQEVQQGPLDPLVLLVHKEKRVRLDRFLRVLTILDFYAQEFHPPLLRKDIVATV